jgi:KDO2-lipid IV(A) lauroyltransferase
MNRLVQGSRTKLGMRVLAGDRIGPQVLRVLRRGEFIALLIDVADARSETHVDFFGAPARVSSAPARIALRTGSWVIPAVVLRGPKDDLIIRPVVDASLRDFTPSGDEEADVQELTRRIMRCLEPHIRAHPDQWFIFQPLWGSSRALPKGVAAANEAV